MRIRARTALVVAATMLVLTGAAMATARFVVQSSYAHLEHDDTVKSTRLVMSWLHDRSTGVDGIARGYAYSDDTCRFVRNGNQEYIDTNLSQVVLAKNGLDFIAFLDRPRDTVYIATRTLDGRGLPAAPTGLTDILASDPSWMHFNVFGEKAVGLMLLPQGPAIVSAHPILPTSTYGLVRGTLLAGKFLDPDRDAATLYKSVGLRATWLTPQSDQFAATLQRMSQGEDGAADPDASSSSQSPSRDLGVLLADGSVHIPNERLPDEVGVEPLSASTVAGYGLLADVAGRPALIVQVKLPRTIAAQGRHALTYLLVGLAAFVVVSIVALVLHLDRSVLRRLSRLSVAVDEISSSRETAGFVPVEGSDEIGQLEGNINRMLVALERSRAALREAAVKDPLTGLSNRRRFEEELERELLESQRTGRCGAILWFDLDNFKDINDTLGHSAGDELLIQFGALLLEQMRKYCVVARWGGDEFAVIVPGADEEEGGRAAARILELLATRTFAIAGRELRVSTSAGVAVYPHDGQTMGPLLAHADAALYTAKATGPSHPRAPRSASHARADLVLSQPVGSGGGGSGDPLL